MEISKLSYELYKRIILPVTAHLIVFVLVISVFLCISTNNSQRTISKNLHSQDSNFLSNYTNILYSSYSLELLRFESYLNMLSDLISLPNVQMKPSFSLLLNESKVNQGGVYYKNRDNSTIINQKYLDVLYRSSSLLFALGPLTNIYEIFNDSSAFVIYNGSEPIPCIDSNCMTSAWYFKAIQYTLYMSQPIDLGDKSSQILCKSSSELLICVEVNIKYQSNMFLTNSKEVIWHQNLDLDLLNSEFNGIYYPFRSQEYAYFTSHVLPYLSTPLNYLEYTNQGELL